MRRFKKTRSLLAVLTVLSVVSATFPIQAFAQGDPAVLQSSFLKSDSEALAIARGDKTIVLPATRGFSDRGIRWKIFNAYRILGYEPDGLPYGETIDAVAIKDIDARVRRMEGVISAKAAKLPFYASVSQNTFINNLPANYGAYVLASIYELVNAGPVKYQTYTPECTWASLFPMNASGLAGGGKKPNAPNNIEGYSQLPFTIQQGSLYGFGINANPYGTVIGETELANNPVASTIVYIDGFIHELTHDMDIGSSGDPYIQEAYPRATSCTGNFMDFKTTDPASPFYWADYGSDDCAVDPSLPPTDPNSGKPAGPKCANYVTAYAATYVVEDVAESVDAYIVAPQYFRERAQGSDLLQRKYNFIRDNIFGGVEFDNPALANFSLEFYAGNTLSNILIAARMPRFVVGDIITHIAAPTATISVSPTSVDYNGRATLTWRSTDATNCTAGGPWSNASSPLGPSSGLTNPLVTNTTFTFQCTGPGGTTPLQSVTVDVLAQQHNNGPYNGELQFPNTRVVPDYRQTAGGGQVTFSTFNNGYFPSAPVFSARESNNFITSLPQKVFSASIQDGVLNCTSQDITINANNNSVVLSYVLPDDSSSSSSSGDDPLCMPIRMASPTTQNTVLTEGGRYGYGTVVQTYDAIPALMLGESVQNTSVESIPNDPNNVRVTVSENVTQEAYGLHFARQGDVERILSGDYRPLFPDNGFYEDGKTYIIHWVSNLIGQIEVTGCIGGEDGGCYVSWSGQVSVYCDDDSHCATDPISVNTGYPTPRITQLASIAPALVSSSVIRPRNSDILSETAPVYTRWSDCSFWRGCTQHMYAIKHELSADGRTGRGIIYQSWDTGGGFREFVGAALLVAGLVVSAQFGIDFSQLFSQVSATFSDFSAGSMIETATGIITGDITIPALTQEAIMGSISGSLTSGIGGSILSFTAGAVAAIAGATALGTVEQQIASSGVEGQEGVWIWTWSQAPGFTPTTGTNFTCPNGATDYPVCTPPPGTCPNGASNYPICTITIIDRLFCPDGTPRPADGCGPTGTTLCPDGSIRPASGICPGGADLCLNIAGIQSTVPAGYTRDASGNCTGGGSGDLCTNLAGIQTSVPAGYTRNASGECVPTIITPPSPISCEDQAPGGAVQCFSVRPTLLRSGERTTLVWNVSDASCSVTGTNNDRWPNQNASRSGGETSSAITGRTTFTLRCAAMEGAVGPPEISESQTVNIIPAFQEK